MKRVKTNKTDHVLNLLKSGTEEEASIEAVTPDVEVSDVKVLETAKEEVAGVVIKKALEIQLNKALKLVGLDYPGEEVLVHDIVGKCFDNYVVVNVVETLIQKRLHKYMAKNNMCMCERCQADVFAVALGALQPQYVVAKNEVDATAVANYYEHSSASRIAVALMNACEQVKSYPRHEKQKA